MFFLRGLYYMTAGLFVMVRRFLCATFGTIVQLPGVIRKHLTTLYEQSKFSMALVILPFVGGPVVAPFFTNSVLQGLLTTLTLLPVGVVGLQYYVWLEDGAKQSFVTFVHEGFEYKPNELLQNSDRHAGWSVTISPFIILPIVQVVALHEEPLGVLPQLLAFLIAFLVGITALFFFNLVLMLLHPAFMWVYSLGESLCETGRELHEPPSS